MILTTLLIIMFVCMFIGLPMVVGMLLASIIAMLVFFPSIGPVMLMQQMMVGVESFVIIAIPMFIFAAEIMAGGESAERLLGFIRAIVGKLPGGMAITTIGACTLFGSCSGSTQATMVAIGKPMSKELEKVGYSKSHTIGLVMCSSDIAMLIPPSIVMIMYALCTGASVSEMFIAGVGPGLILAVGFSLWELFYYKKNKINHGDDLSKEERIRLLKRGILPLGFPIIILGGIYSGIFTPTEASAVAVVYTFIIEKFVYKSIKWKDIFPIATRTAVTTAAIFVLLSAGQAFSWIVSYAGIPRDIANAMTSITSSPTGLLLIIALTFLIACMFVDALPVILIMVPIFYPIIHAAGVDTIQFGMIVTMLAAIGCETPPFGCNLFTAAAIYDEPFTTIVKGVVPYEAIEIIVTLLMIFVPQVALWFHTLLF